MIESWPSLCCFSIPICLVLKMLCYPLTFVGTRSNSSHIHVYVLCAPTNVEYYLVPSSCYTCHSLHIWHPENNLSLTACNLYTNTHAQMHIDTTIHLEYFKQTVFSRVLTSFGLDWVDLRASMPGQSWHTPLERLLFLQ